MVLINTVMEDAGPYLDLSSLISGQDDGIHSPRTPTYAPTSLSFANVQPFDPSRLLRTLSHTKSTKKRNQVPSPPPAKPLAWVWQCHLCRSRWPLSATRRCLVDGHYYCSGEQDQRNLKKKKKGQSCSSEFDYVGWREWCEWKREALKSVENPPPLKGCEICEFPSQCRYSKSADVDIRFPGAESNTSSSSPNGPESQDKLPRYYQKENVSFEAILAEVLVEGLSSKQSKVTNLDKSNERSSEKKAVKVFTSDKGRKSSKTKSSMKSALSPIEEEMMKAEVSAEVQDLVMPMVDFRNREGPESASPSVDAGRPTSRNN